MNDGFTDYSGVNTDLGYKVNDVAVVGADGKVVVDQTIVSEARTATTDGLTTGQISSGTTQVVVTSDDANKIITLPAPVPGKKLLIINGATGYELRSTDPATVGINGGVGSNAESAIGANMILELFCVSATNWVGNSYTSAGVKGVVQVAAA